MPGAFLKRMFWPTSAYFAMSTSLSLQETRRKRRAATPMFPSQGDAMKLITLFAVLLLGACGTVPPSKESLLVPEPCCCTYTELSYLPLPQSEELSIKIDGTSQAFAFPEGNSYLAAFKLPKIESDTTFELKTYMSTPYLPAATVFLPQILILDA